jgi:hypothetical protein
MLKLLPAVAVLSSLPIAAASAQQLVGFNYAGQVFAIDSNTGSATLVRTNSNAFYLDSARLPDGRLVALHRSNFQHQNHTIFGYRMREMSEDGSPGQSLITDTVFDAIAPKADNEVWVLESGVLETRVIHHIANTLSVSPFPHIFLPGDPEGLTVHGGWLYSYSSTHGLLRIDPATGNYIDVDPATGGTANIRFLTARNDGYLFGGADDLYRIDPTTGAEVFVGHMGNIDLRAAEFPRGYATPIGQGCASVGPPPALSLNGDTARAGSIMQPLSGGHAPGSLAWLAIEVSPPGASAPLPVLDLDPVLGTSGCQILVRPDAWLPLQVNLAGFLSTQIALPPAAAGWNLGLQYFVLEPAPGVLAATHAAWVAVSP